MIMGPLIVMKTLLRVMQQVSNVMQTELNQLQNTVVSSEVVCLVVPIGSKGDSVHS